jgi:hypothetical protein
MEGLLGFTVYQVVRSMGQAYDQYPTCHGTARLALISQPTAKAGGDARDAGAVQIRYLADREEEGLRSVETLYQVSSSPLGCCLNGPILKLCHGSSRIQVNDWLWNPPGCYSSASPSLWLPALSSGLDRHPRTGAWSADSTVVLF